MGQRANYIIKYGDTHTIYYNHWRAPQIPSDLYLGEKRFLDFVETCRVSDVLLNELWIEGCVVIDKPNRNLHFWSGHFGQETSVHRLYLQELAKKWNGWTVAFMPNRMYDIDQILGINYISGQELPRVHEWTATQILENEPDNYLSTLVIVKNEHTLFVTEMGDFCTEPIIAYGSEVVSLLLPKPQIPLPKEGHDVGYEAIIIDEVEKHIYINLSNFGLWEQCAERWPGYKLTMGNYGYLGILEHAGINVSHLQMAPTDARKLFEDIVKPKDNFNPMALAGQILAKENNVQFNSNFFDNVQPRKNWINRLKQFFGRF